MAEELCRLGVKKDQRLNTYPCLNSVTGEAPQRRHWHYGFTDGWTSKEDMWPSCTLHSRRRAMEIVTKDQMWAIRRLL